THFVASEAAVAELDELLVRRIGRLRLAGKTAALAICEVLARDDRATDDQRELCRRYAEALAAFEEARWAAAAAAFDLLLLRFPADGPSRFCLELCRQYQARPPEEEAAVAAIISLT